MASQMTSIVETGRGLMPAPTGGLRRVLSTARSRSLEVFLNKSPNLHRRCTVDAPGCTAQKQPASSASRPWRALCRRFSDRSLFRRSRPPSRPRSSVRSSCCAVCARNRARYRSGGLYLRVSRDTRWRRATTSAALISGNRAPVPSAGSGYFPAALFGRAMGNSHQRSANERRAPEFSRFPSSIFRVR